MSASGGRKTRLACKYFLSGACNKGPACQFAHDRSAPPDNSCRYFQAGSCVYGRRCRYDHIRPKPPSASATAPTPASAPKEAPKVRPTPAAASMPLPLSGDAATPAPKPVAPLNSVLRPQAAEFVPASARKAPPSYASAAGASLPSSSAANADPNVSANPADKICPYHVVGECYFGAENCPFTHGLPCDLCGKALLHPAQPEQNRAHRAECMAEMEAEMEAAFAAAASEGKTCGICMDVVREKAEKSQRRFGILTNCKHCFCLRCIRQWRGQAEEATEPGAVDKRTVRRCPECRVSSEFVVPSAVWVEEAEAKAALIAAYRQRLGLIPCKYYASEAATSECPFGNRCHYRHELADGRLDPGEDPSIVQRRIRARRQRGAPPLLADFLALRALADRWLHGDDEDLDEEDFPDWLDEEDWETLSGASAGGPPVAPPPPEALHDEAAAEAWLIGQLQEDFANLAFFSISDNRRDAADESWDPPPPPQPPSSA